MPDNALQFLFGTGRRVLVGAAEPRTEQPLAAEDVQRQVAVLAVVAVKETPFLMPVYRIVGRPSVRNPG
jgi:hypothetical protein